MTTKKEFKKAQQVINDYTIQVNKILVKSRICICCRTKEISPDDIVYGKATEQEQGCWDGGTVQKITFGYGSRFDLEAFYIAICDDCIGLLEKEGLAVNFRTITKEENKYFDNDRI